MTPEDIRQLDHYQIQDLFVERGIKGTYRTHEGVWVMLLDGRPDRVADEEETRLHERSVFCFHMEEAQAGLL